MLLDLVCAFRWLRHHTVFTAIVLVTLALGIGATTAVFSIVDAVLLRPLPYRSPDRLVKVEQGTAKHEPGSLPAPDYLQVRDRRDLFQQTAAFTYDVITVTEIDTPDQLLGMRTSASLFSMLGVHARLGRTLAETDDTPGAPPVALLSDKLWRRLFHADPAIVGRAIRAGDAAITIVGVMPPEFEFPAPDKEFWLPLQLTPASKDALLVIARLANGATIAQANSALDSLARQFEQQDPVQRAGLRLIVGPWSEDAGAKTRLSLIFVLSAVGLLLLIACANVASLMLSRAVQRQKEIAIRACLGAGFWRVVRQLLAESLLLAAAGSAAGIAVASWLLRVLSARIAALPIVMPHMQQVAVTVRVLAFNAAVCIAASLFFSVVPVLVAAKIDLQTALRSGRGTGAARGSARVFSFMIAAEAALAFLLLAGAGLMIRSLIRLEQADLGIHPDHVLTMRVPLGSVRQQRPRGFETKPQQTAYFQRLVDRLQTVPGVRAAALVNNLPLSPYNTTLSFHARSNAAETKDNVRARCVSPRYFDVMGIPLLAGRDFTDADQSTAPPVIIINQQMARVLFPSGSPVGQMLLENDISYTVVGVVKDSPQMSYDQPPQPEIYLAFRQMIFGSFLAALVVRTQDDPLALAATLQKEVWAVNRDQPIVKVETMDAVIANSIWRPRFSAWVLSVISALALILMSAGVYGVIAYTASLRSQELGIRVALGATPGIVASTILRGALVPLSLGLATAIAAALVLHRLLASLLYGITGVDPATYLTSVAVLLAIGSLASAGPAWKAATADPLQSLRSD